MIDEMHDCTPALQQCNSGLHFIGGSLHAAYDTLYLTSFTKSISRSIIRYSVPAGACTQTHHSSMNTTAHWMPIHGCRLANITSTVNLHGILRDMQAFDTASELAYRMTLGAASCLSVRTAVADTHLRAFHCAHTDFAPGASTRTADRFIAVVRCVAPQRLSSPHTWYSEGWYRLQKSVHWPHGRLK
ncbi:hypothetical protein HETIRDRAFT_331529 [Heterobasidion irregulare TC 32-1]|uniref:Uncharacterized protein n=1 Tax=Heterobasidion irregulare (strain TC 32-1) TaxID=747525 RepID=W4JQ18_HETIT|nr:uncharacterized protein HETIRDRAFT_331529 [Heterobasidion irregulare TC 32-1]ETW75628.1 hypothetical protein HETIRDRAFT_331529 [Heterobasidion irregulare TC 32-1]